MTTFRAIPFLVAAAVAGGCYRYVPADPGDVTVGTQMRAILTPTEAQRMRTVLATGDTLVDGTVTAVTPEAFEFRVAGVNLPGRTSVEPLYQQVTVARRDITAIELRQFDRTRTALVAVGGAALAGAVVAGIWEHSRIRDDGEFPGGDESRLPVIRIPISLPVPLPRF